jgi:hypothetical protein
MEDIFLSKYYLGLRGDKSSLPSTKNGNISRPPGDEKSQIILVLSLEVML